MFKHKVIAVILLTAVFISGKAYSQQANKDHQVMTVSGKVLKTDVEGGVIDVQTDNGTMVFYLSTESNLFRSTHHMASIEIAKDDLVTIQYINSSDKHDVVSLVDKPADY